MDTIVALATPIGRSGIGVVRLSGSDSLAIVRRICGQGGFDPRPRQAILANIVDPSSGETLDEAIVTYFRSPRSFTGEDVVEISCHGSPVVLRQVVDLCLVFGARPAEAGEFSLRALANGRMNLSQAEAIRDLIDAQTVASARQSVRQLQGELSNRLQPLKDELLDVIVVLESTLEFVEDDLPELQSAGLRTRMSEIAGGIRKMAGTFRAGRLLREGLKVALVGRPNVGKSSLFNALLGHERAIVTDIAGTTRDQLHERLVIDNIPISLIDTAGLRETKDEIESIGVERARLTMNDADLVLVLLDGSRELSEEDLEILGATRGLNRLIVINKSDLDPDGNVAGQLADQSSPTIRISAKTGSNLGELGRMIVDPFEPGGFERQGFLISDARHFDLLERAAAEIESSIGRLDEKLSEEIVLIGLHNAIRFLGQITGETTTEDMLTRIFSTFCIGK